LNGFSNFTNGKALVEDFEHSHCPSSSTTDENIQKVKSFMRINGVYLYVCNILGIQQGTF